MATKPVWGPQPEQVANDKLNAMVEYSESLAGVGTLFLAADPQPAGLFWNYNAGRIRNTAGAIVEVAAGQVALTASATNYIEVDASGAVSANTTGFTLAKKPLRVLTTDAGSVLTSVDKRVDFDFVSTPTSGAGGVLSGSYPNPGFAVDMATQSELDAVAAAKADVSHTHAAADITSGVLPIARLATGTPDGTKFIRDDGVLATPPGVVTSVSGTAPIVSSGGATPAISISAATTSDAGSMSAADKTKLDGVATGATANSADSYLLDRTNHTGTQAQSTVTNLTTDLAAKAPLASPALTGTPTAPTATAGTNTTQIATTAFVLANAPSGGASTPITASEALAANDIVSVWNSSGAKVRKANATDSTKIGIGFVDAAVSSSASATVKFAGIISGLSGLTIGADYFLSTTGGGITTTPPSASGNIVQKIGTALSATELLFAPGAAVELA